MGLIFICQNKDKQHVPAVLSDYHIIHYDINNISRMTKDAEGALSQLIARGRSSESRVFKERFRNLLPEDVRRNREFFGPSATSTVRVLIWKRGI